MMVQEDGSSYGNLVAFNGRRIMEPNDRLKEMLRKFCDVGQLEFTKLFMAKPFFWKDDVTVVSYHTRNTKYYMSIPPMKTSVRQELIENTIKSPDWQERITTYQSKTSRPWDSLYYEDPSTRRY